MADKGSKGLSVTKEGNFSEWYSELVQKAELADLRYNVKGFLVFQPWSVMVMERMYRALEDALQRKGHKPYWFPTVIPETNLTKESEHIKGFTPEVFWIERGGEKQFEERLALRPTSETAFYQMFALWIRSYKDLPFKTYQRANVFRYETKATRPFLRSREFHWIETHCVHADKQSAEIQVKEDMETTEEVLHQQFGLPFIFFERPFWDKFPGADRTFAADVLNPDGRVVQQPSTHLISQHFIGAFGVTYKDASGKEQTPYATCYGPSVSRLFASVAIVHGDDKGLRLPWSLAPYQIVIVPVKSTPPVLKKAQELKEQLAAWRVHVDDSDKSAGEKFNTWELKGVPLRIDVGEREIAEKKVSVFRRDSNKKELVGLKELEGYVAKVARQFDTFLMKQADSVFNDRIKDAKTIEGVKKIIESGGIARCAWCSTEKDGARCAEKVESESGAKVRGTRLDKEKVSGMCISCGKKATSIVYIAREY